MLLAAAPLRAQPAPLQISPTSLPLAGLNQTYNVQLTATGQPGPYFWRVQGLSPGPDGSTALPNGFTLNSTGVISGTPKAAGILPFTVQVFSQNQAMGSAQLQIITIQVETDSPLPEGKTGVAYSQSLTVTAGNPTWALGQGQMPPGLTLSSTGILSGTPTSAGTFLFGLQATVPNTPPFSAVVAQKSFQLTISVGPVGFSTSSLPDGTVGTAYSEVVRAAGGAPPYTVTAVDATLPPGIGFVGGQLLTGTPNTPGTYQAQFRVQDSQGATASRTLPINILPATGSGPLLNVSPRTLRFTAFEGAGPTPPQNVTIASTTGQPVTFSAVIAGAPVAPPAWLAIANQASITPALVHLRANPGSMPPGPYQTTIRISTSGQASIDVAITFVIQPAAPHLDVSPRVVQTSSRTANPRATFTILLRNTGGGPTVDYDVSVVGKSSWIGGLASTPSRLAANQRVVIRFTVDITGLKAGAYRDELLIRTGIGNTRVPVALFVERSGPVLGVSTRGVRLGGRQGDPPDAQRIITIRNRGTAGTSVNWTATLVRGSDVFTITPAQGTATPGSPSTLTIGLKPNAADTAGSRTALLRISDPNAQASPNYVVLFADIAPASAPPPVDLNPDGLAFTAIAGATPPTPQTFQVRTTAKSVNFTTAASTANDGTWLSVSPASGTAASGRPSTVTVSVASANLTPGVYTGFINVSIGTEATQVYGVGVTLIVLPAGAKLTQSDTKSSITPRAAEGCTPAQVAIVQTGLSESFSVPAGWPATLSVTLLDDCGGALSNGSVVASFSNGDAPVVLEGDGQTSDYIATWQPISSAASATVRIEAGAGLLQPAALELTGGVEPNPASPPSLVTAGLLNNLTGTVGGALAPGTVTQIYGTDMAATPEVTGVVPLPTQYKGVEAIIGGLSAPIYYISPTQLTVQVPTELQPNQIYSALLITNSGYSLPIPVPIVPVQPGTYATPEGLLVAQHTNASLVTAANPAKPGEAIAIYLVGMGATSPAVASGTASPFSPLAIVNTGATVMIDNQPAEILYQGLAPGAVGLYQLNLRIPANARAGNLDIVISQDGVEANATQLFVTTP